MEKLKGKPLTPRHLQTGLADHKKVITGVTVALIVYIWYHSYWKTKNLFLVVMCGPYLGCFCWKAFTWTLSSGRFLFYYKIIPFYSACVQETCKCGICAVFNILYHESQFARRVVVWGVWEGQLFDYELFLGVLLSLILFSLKQIIMLQLGVV